MIIEIKEIKKGTFIRERYWPINDDRVAMFLVLDCHVLDRTLNPWEKRAIDLKLLTIDGNIVTLESYEHEWVTVDL